MGQSRRCFHAVASLECGVERRQQPIFHQIPNDVNIHRYHYKFQMYPIVSGKTVSEIKFDHFKKLEEKKNS